MTGSTRTDALQPSPAGRDTSGWWHRPAAAALAAAVALGVLTWQVVVDGPLLAADWPLHQYVDARQPDGLLRLLGDGVARLGGQRLFTLPLLLLVAAFVSHRQRRLRPLVATVVGVLVVGGPGYLLKLTLERSAPAAGYDALHAGGQAFPSGHTANATLTWLLVVVLLVGSAGWRPAPRLFRRWIVVAAVLVVVVGLLMTLLDYHWLSDIPGGWLLGMVAVLVARLALGPPVPVRQAGAARSPSRPDPRHDR